MWARNDPHKSTNLNESKIMKYIIAARKQQYIVDAETEFRAIQAVIAATDLIANDITLCQIFNSYPAHMQTRLIATSTTLN